MDKIRELLDRYYLAAVERAIFEYSPSALLCEIYASGKNKNKECEYSRRDPPVVE